MAKVGEEYEKAVYEFVKILDPSAEVLFDHYVPDSETGKPRQCDVWINVRYAGIFPVSFYVSCKDTSRKKDEGHIDWFNGEMKSRRATNGVIYSKKGFTVPALEKAEKLGISCCKIYVNEPADLPKTLTFEHYANYPAIGLDLIKLHSATRIYTWNEIFSLVVNSKTVVEIIETEFNADLDEMINNSKIDGSIPKSWERQIDIFSENNDIDISIKILGLWKTYTAKQEAILYNGSYCMNDGGVFRGSFIGPIIDTQGSNPGPGWTLIEKQKIELSTNKISAYMHRGQIKEQLIIGFGDKLLSK